MQAHPTQARLRDNESHGFPQLRPANRRTVAVTTQAALKSVATLDMQNQFNYNLVRTSKTMQV